MNFKDHFSKQSKAYATFRPRYPDALFRYLATLTPKHQLAWDCATGNGQAALGLAPYFEKIIATDASPAQIFHTTPHPKITYAVSPAEEAPMIPSNGVDLVIVAQAMHWFDRKKFYKEALRVSKKEGILAIWCYVESRISPAIDTVIKKYHDGIVGSFWPPERKWIDEHFKTFDLPFPEIPSPPFQMEAQWNLEDLLGYWKSWSATQNYIEKQKTDPTELIRDELTDVWGDPEEKRKIIWPVYLRASRLP